MRVAAESISPLSPHSTLGQMPATVAPRLLVLVMIWDEEESNQRNVLALCKAIESEFDK